MKDLSLQEQLSLLKKEYENEKQVKKRNTEKKQIKRKMKNGE